MMHVASVHLKCFRCFRGMFQLFHTDVTKVDQDVAYISHICCKCFIWMFAYVCNDFQLFLQVFQMHVSSVSSVFFLYVASVSERGHEQSPRG
jgi:hypothetical protein